MNQTNLELFEAELDLAAMTPQEREEAEKKASLLAMLEKIRIKPDMDLPPLEFLCPLGGREEKTRLRTYLGAMRYTTDEMDHPVRELSGGQRAKLLLLKMSLSGANVLILDEPTRNFSPLSGPVIRRLLAEYPGVVISVSHDRKFLSEVCMKVYELTGTGLEETKNR